MRPYCGAPCIYRVSRRSRYHSLTQIQSYTWGAVLTLTRGIEYFLRSRTLPCSAIRKYLFTAERSF